MYAAYGSTAQSNMFPIAFAIIFGNEDKEGWTKFWQYAVTLHPTINAPMITIITDQDKGSEAAVKACLPLAFHFHCAWHRLKNIHGRCIGGNKPNTAGRLFNLLSKAHTLVEIEHLRNVHQDCLNPNHLDYLNSVPDNSQFPAARCAMGTERHRRPLNYPNSIYNNLCYL